MALSMPKLEAWATQKIGSKRAQFPSIEAATAALEEVFKENSLYQAATFKLFGEDKTGDANVVAIVLSGEGVDFQKACQLLEAKFSAP